MTQYLDENNWQQLRDQLRDRSDNEWHAKEERVLEKLEDQIGKTREGLREEDDLSDGDFEEEVRKTQRRTDWERRNDGEPSQGLGVDKLRKDPWRKDSGKQR